MRGVLRAIGYLLLAVPCVLMLAAGVVAIDSLLCNPRDAIAFWIVMGMIASIAGGVCLLDRLDRKD